MVKHAAPKPRFEWTPDAREFFAEKHADKWSDAAIARELGCHQTSVLLYRRREGLPPNQPPGNPRIARPGWGFCGAATEHTRALSAAGWRWPLMVGDVAVDLPPKAVRVLLLLLGGGPLTRPEIVKGLGLPERDHNLSDGHPKKPLLTVLECRGLIAGRPRGDRPAWAITADGAKLLAVAAEWSSLGDSLPRPEQVASLAKGLTQEGR